jgi:uncharacterized protein (DUF58 family)
MTKASLQLRDDPLDARQFELSIRKLADTLAYGQQTSAFLGSGLEFAQSRPYQTGDAVKSIDWRVTGKTGRVHVKEYEAPRRMPVYLMIDTSASMLLSSMRANSKYQIALQIAGAIALASLRQSNPVGILAVGSRQLHSPANSSKRSILGWLNQLRSASYEESTRVGEKLRALAAQLKQTSVLILLSDLHDPLAHASLRTLAQQHDCAVVHLQDPVETQLPRLGIFRAREAETGIPFTATRHFNRSPAFNPSELAAADISYLKILVGTEFVGPLRHFLLQRIGRRNAA